MIDAFDSEEGEREMAKALFVSARDGRLAEVRGLLGLGANPNASIDRNSRGKGSALGAAVAAGSVECAEAILAAGGDIEALWRPQAKGSSRWGTPLHWAAGGGHAQMVALLVEHGAMVGAVGSGGETPLHRAAEKGRGAATGILIDAGADLGVLDNGGRTPLMAAAWGGHAWCLGQLGAAAPERVNQAMVDGRSALMLAMNESLSAEAVQALLDAGADPSQSDKHGRQPLAEAMGARFLWGREERAGQKPQVARALLAAGADPNARDERGITALRALAESGVSFAQECAAILMEAGGDPRLGGYGDGKSAIETARSAGHAELASFMEAMAVALIEERELDGQVGGGIRRVRDRAGL